MQIKDEDYRVVYDELTVTFTFYGALRLRGADEYKPIVNLLDRITVSPPDQVTLDVRHLQFLNSSGINVLFRFAIKLRNFANCELLVLGSAQVPWQNKSLRNITRLMPKATLQLD